MTDSDWQAVIRWGAADRQGPAIVVPWLRRTEVEVHHVDLNLDYTLAHWPEDFVEQMLAETAQDFSSRESMASFTLVGNEDQGRWDVAGGGLEINGPPPALLGWLLGRSEGIALHTEGSLPEIGAWR
jgi:maleylpyruvate isomerase